MDRSKYDGQILNSQQPHWEKVFSRKVDMFGTEISFPARQANNWFQREGVSEILELGAGQGRDSLYFAQQGYSVKALDYSEAGLANINNKAMESELTDRIKTRQHDVREPLPFADNSFDACYSHMLLCMALTMEELGFLCGEVRRVLKRGGLNIYTVRHQGDAHYRQGPSRGEDMYEMGGYIVHFFNKQKIKQLANGFQIIRIEEFKEGKLPRELYQVTLRKIQ